MLWAGYSLKDREIVARKILAKYNNDLQNLKIEGKPLYRTKEDRKHDVNPLNQHGSGSLGPPPH